ncbi:MAG: hypothetical protein JSW00_10010 [Thermoplasmata archaeon]|nr:MAG: hypothetical protein JSW00_10010 [Thermoplasmata archaeon]
MKQIEVAKRLGITQASVSQYLSSTRGEDEEFQKLFPEIGEYAKSIAEKIASGEDKEHQVALLCEMCSTIREEGKFCEYHRNFLQIDECGICLKTSTDKADP